MKARSDELQIFVSVIECGSISAAAEKVGQTPSAVSRTLSRLEAKLDLVMVLLGRLVRQSVQDLPLRPLRWSRRGIRLEQGSRSGAAPGSMGVIRLQPCDWLPDHIDLPVVIVAEAANGSGAHYLWLSFEGLSDALEMALERHLFRLHRRQIAEARRLR